ncbi:MAG: hypothetical protein KatS3mg105_4589 [Gemmatales bacterium]|nr:MAG: hypothetical protein KatS3mg105_4589 [Gemmatales bacterium]
MNADAKTLAKQFQPKQTKVLKPDRQLVTIRFSPCGKYLAGGGFDSIIRRWDVAATEPVELPPLKGHGGWVQAIVFHPDKRRLFSVDSWGQLFAWPYADKNPQRLWSVDKAHDGWIRDVAISADGKWLATCGFDQMVRIWSTDNGKKLGELAGHGCDVFSVAFHPSGQSVVSGDLKGVVKQWDLKTNKVVKEFDARIMYKLSRLQDVGGVRRLAFDPLGATLGCAGTQPTVGANVQGTPTILLFDWQTGKVKHKMTIGGNGDGFVFDFHFHPAGFVMAVTSGNPGTGKFFFQKPGDAKPFFLATNLPNCHALAVHPDGKHLAVSATNPGSNGNGRQLKNNQYVGNFSPVHLFEMAGA